MANNPKYKIAFLMHGAKNIGGGEYSIFFLIKYLNRDIFEPVVFYSNKNKIIDKIENNGIKTVKIPINTNITSIYRDEIKNNLANMLSYSFYMFSAITVIKKAIEENEIDILHPHDNLSKIIGGIAGKLSGIKVVAHCRDELKNDFVGNIFRVAYKYLINKIIAVSEKTAEFLKENSCLKKKTLVIYNGVDINLFNPENISIDLRKELNIDRNCIVLTVVAVLETYKGHIYLFDAIKLLKDNGIIKFKLLIAGDGRAKNSLIEYVNTNDLNENIIFLGYRTDIPEILNATDLLVIPSMSEAFPRVAIESMAMKVPVVCTDVGGLPEAIISGETGVVVPPKDIDALYKGIKSIMYDTEARRKMGEAGRKRVLEYFNIENNVRKTEMLYLDILKNY